MGKLEQEEYVCASSREIDYRRKTVCDDDSKFHKHYIYIPEFGQELQMDGMFVVLLQFFVGFCFLCWDT
jgi:hypothetical protein